MKQVEGYVERITYRNEDNGYSVIYLSNPEPKADEDDEVCCVGYFSFVSEGEYLVIDGRETVHKSYGPQIQVESYETKRPSSQVAIEKYLGSGAIKGIGAALAARIVRRFGEKTFEIIENEPERLAEIKGISMKMAVSVAKQFNDKRQMRQSVIFLQEYGISVNMAVKIYKFYGEKIYEIMQQNPYRLAEDIAGIGFKIADTIALKAGFNQDSEFRIKAGILYVLQQSGSNGHCYLPETELIDETAGLLGIERENVERELDNLTLNKELVIEECDGERRLYQSNLYYMEMNCGRMLHDLNIPYKIKPAVLEKKIAAIEKKDKIELDKMQKDAVFQAVQNGIMIITGGPGTGKTTTINTIIQIMESEGFDILLAAPTGRAAKRMSETSGMEAQTIHRMLEIDGGSLDDDRGGMHFERNETKPLEADVIIVDEFSMVDIYMLNALLKAIVPGTRLIMVGDVNQLPSVGPGNVLKDMIKSEFCNVVKLNRIFRQAAESQIVTNAHKINDGEQISLDNKNMDFFHLERSAGKDVINVTVQLIMKNLPPYVDATSYDIQVLTPMQRGVVGAANLNLLLQQALNPSGPSLNRGGYTYRQGDRVMQQRNNYDKDVFNGDLGYIREVDTEERTLKVDFDGKWVEYDVTELDELTLAYATTIHKAQGSEYPIVVMPVLMTHFVMLQRNLIYTGITRAKKICVLIGATKALAYAVHNMSVLKRNTSLRERLNPSLTTDGKLRG